MSCNSFRFVFCAIMMGFALSGCGNRYFSPRTTNPLIEDRVRMGSSDSDKMSALTSRADRRTVLVFGRNEVCAEPPPDVAEAIYSQTVAKLSNKETEASFDRILQTAIMQLTRRSQGLDFFRTGSFVYCMMSYNGVLLRSEYIAKMEELLRISSELTKAELDHLPEVATAIAQVTNPKDGSANEASDKNEEKEPSADP